MFSSLMPRPKAFHAALISARGLRFYPVSPWRRARLGTGWVTGLRPVRKS